MFVVLTVCLVLGHSGRPLTGAALVFLVFGVRRTDRNVRLKVTRTGGPISVARSRLFQVLRA